MTKDSENALMEPFLSHCLKKKCFVLTPCIQLALANNVLTVKQISSSQTLEIFPLVELEYI